MEEKVVGQGQLQRRLKQRHLTMIAIGGSIGTALFLSTGYALNQAGPGGIVGAYLLVAVMIYFIIMSLGEMATYLPCAGSFQSYASLYVSPSFGFSIGWNYWFSWAVTVGIEVVAASLIMKYWFPNVPSWIFSIVFVVIVVGLNLLSASAYGEAEFWFASIKVCAVVSFILVGIGMMTGFIGNEGAIGFTNFVHSEGGLFPKGAGGILTVTFTAVFCFLGTEIVGIAAGEGKNPEITIPKAVKTVFVRIAIFYIGATFMVAALIPWMEGTVNVSPFTLVFTKLGISFAATIMNVVVLTSTLSCANAGLYASSRMVFAMAKEGKAPKVFANVNKRGVPVPALLLTGCMGGAAFLSRFISPDKVYVLLVSASAITVLFSWIGICMAHINFRKFLKAQGKSVSDLKFKAPFYPYGPWIAGILCVIVIIAQFFSADTRITAMLGVPMFFILWGIGKYKEKKGTLWVPSEESIRGQSHSEEELDAIKGDSSH